MLDRALLSGRPGGPLPATSGSDCARLSRRVRHAGLLQRRCGRHSGDRQTSPFLRLPRPNLRRAQKLVREFCHEHDVSYCETTLIRSWRQALSHLDAVGAGTAHALAS